MNNKEILNIAMAQSAIDLHCDAEAFQKSENIIVYSEKNAHARKYLNLPFACNMVSYGNNIVASTQPEYHGIVEEYLSKYDVSHCFETPNMHVIDEAFAAFGFQVCFMAEYFLPDVNDLKILPCPYETRIMESKDFIGLYTKQWSNALCEKRKELDVLGVGGFDNGKLAGLASALTSRLAAEILRRGKVPFYCCAWCNIKSVRNALKSGFKPAWAEMTVQSKEMIDEMNRQERESAKALQAPHS